MNMKKIFLISSLVLIFMAGNAGTVLAHSEYLTTFNNSYGTGSTALNDCNLCHGQTKSISNLNGYGSDWRTNGKNFKTIETFDSDGDTFSNIEEINARTFPGAASDFPNTSPPPSSNTPPVADAGGNLSVASAAKVTLDGSGSYDPDGDSITYSWTQTGGSSVNLAGAKSNTATFTAPQTSNSDISLTFQLAVSDGTETSVDNCSVTVTRQERAPVAGSGSEQTVAGGVKVTLDGSNAYDPDGDAITYSWEQTGGDNVNLSGSSSAVATFTAPEIFGSSMALKFTLTVNDSTGMTDTADYIVNVSQTNRAPVADAGPVQTVDAGTDVTLSGQGSDPDGDAITYSWEQTGGVEVTLSDASIASPTFTAPDSITVIQFKLTVSDSSGLIASDTCTVNVNAVDQPLPNTAPVANAGEDQFVLSGDTVILDGSQSSDPDGDAITFSWERTGGVSVTLAEPASESPSFIAPEASDSTIELVFTLTVDDGAFQANDSVTVYVEPVEVIPVNDPPVADAGSDMTAAPGDTVSLDGTGSYDPDEDTISYQWTQTQGVSMALLNSDTATAQFQVPSDITETTTLTFELTVTDGLLSNSDTVTVTIVPVSDTAPGASLDDPVAMLEEVISDPLLKRGESRSLERSKTGLTEGLDLLSNGNIQAGIHYLENAMDGIQRALRRMPESVVPMLRSVHGAVQTLIDNATAMETGSGYDYDDGYHDVYSEYDYQRSDRRDIDSYDD
jgi:hypothetical protein